MILRFLLTKPKELQLKVWHLKRCKREKLFCHVQACVTTFRFMTEAVLGNRYRYRYRKSTHIVPQKKSKNSHKLLD